MRPVQREDEKPPALLAERVLGDERLELGHEQGRLAAGEPRREQLFPRDVAQPRESGHLGVGPGLARVLDQRGAPPQRKGVLEHLGDRARVVESGRVPEKLLEPPGVHSVVRQPEGVPRALAHDHAAASARRGVRLEAPSQVRDVGLQRPRRVDAGVVAPQRVGEPLRRDHVPAREQQQGEHRTLAATAEVQLGLAVVRRELAQHTDA
jgi:hypothetical protein